VGAELLRVTVLVESTVVPAWQASLTERLSSSPSVEVTVVEYGRTRPSPRRRPFLLTLYERVDSEVFRWPLDALAHRRLPGVGAPSRDFAGQHVVVDFASCNPSEVVRGVRDGAWVVTHHPPDWHARGSTYRTDVHAHFDGGRRALIHSSMGAMDPASPSRTRQQALWKAQGTLLHLLETVRRLGMPYLEARARRLTLAREASAESRHQPLSNRAVAANAARAVAGVAGRLARGTVEREAWFVATRPRTRPRSLDSGDGFQPTEWSRHTAAADPFVIEADGETYVFFEDDSKRGPATISYVRLDRGGLRDGAPATALERPYHLSYPFVFRHAGGIFMIPESSENRTIELYRADAFPSSWTLERVLLEDIRALDATLVDVDGRLWLFVSVAEPGAAPNDELHLFSADSLEGPWEPHPANPVVSDVRSARPAGRIFRHAGDLIRPSQDCSRRYGYAVVFNRIDVLTDDDYVESPIGRIDPVWYPGIVATHTYDAGKEIEVLDGKRVALRGPLARLRR